MTIQEGEKNYAEYLYNKLQKSSLLYEEVEYSHSLFRKLISRQYMENGRSSTKEKVLEQLLDIAEQIDTSSIEGALSSVFVYHQVAEESLYDLLELIRFFVDLKLYPDRIQHKPSEGMKLSALIGEIKSSINFMNKEDLIKYADLVNQNRNSFAHDLLKKDSVEAIKKDLDRFMKHFKKMYEALDGTEEYLYGARESLLEGIKQFNKWSDEFHDKHISLLTVILEDNDITHLSEEEFEAETNAS